MTAYVFKRVKDYYKYEYQDWTQPIMTANGTMGGDSFATSQTGFSDAGLEAYRAFDNNTSTLCYFAKSTGYFQWYNPNPLKITNLKLTNYIGDSWGTRALTSGSIQVSNNGSDFVELKAFTNSVTGGGASWNIDLSANTGYYKYYRIVCTGTSYAVSNAANQCHIAELKITATEQITVKGSAADYDFRTSKAYVLKRKQYWKYEYQNWTQPVLTANGTMGSNSFAVAQSSSYNSNDFWKLFSSSPSDWHSAAGVPQWVSWYNPKPLKVKKLYFSEMANGQIGNFIIQACDDNSSWVDILSYSNTVSKDAFEVDLSSNDKAYKYWRIYITSCYYVYNGAYYPLINDGFTITAQEQTVIKATKDDYDFITDRAYVLRRK